MDAMLIGSIELRRRVVEGYKSAVSGTYEQTARVFAIGVATVSRWLRRERESGDVFPKARAARSHRKVDLDWLRQHAADHPDARLIDRVEAWEAHSGTRVHIDTMSSSLRAIGWTYKKKTPSARERDRPEVKAKQDEFRSQQHLLEPSKRVFVDESGFRLGGTPRYGWAPRGEDAPGSHVQGKWETMTMVGALALDGFRGFMTIDAGTGNDVFRAFVQKELVPNLKAGDIVVMDNLSAHKSKPVVTAIENTEARVLFTPPYSPEFNPIEKTWGKIKDILRRAETLTREAFDGAVSKAMDAITDQDRRGWLRHAGYAIS